MPVMDAGNSAMIVYLTPCNAPVIRTCYHHAMVAINRYPTFLAVAALVLLSLSPGIVHAANPVIVRPQLGFGYLDAGNSNSGPIQHAGLRLLLTTADHKRYGLEATAFRPDHKKGFNTLGIVLEQRLWNGFNMSIGTVGYFDYDAPSGNPVGLMTNLGWEPGRYKNFTPFVTYRTDFVFAAQTAIVHSLSAGLSFHF